MEIFITALFVIIAVVVCVMIVLKKRNGASGVIPKEEGMTIPNEQLQTVANQELTIQLEQLPAETQIDESSLVEITDKRMINRITSLVPGSAQVLNNVGSVAQYNEAIKAGGPLYQAVLKKGGSLAKSTTMDNAVRGFSRNSSEIVEQANFLSAEKTVSKMAAVNVTNAIFNVASLVVGQYYMTQINSELDVISDSISKIADFQNNEYKSKVYALIGQVQKIATFQMETLENGELRNRELSNLQGLEKDCTELLGQANLALADFTKKKDLDYDQYEKLVKEADDWYRYQQILTEVLYKIGDLTYTLNLGAVSREYCYAMYPTYFKQAEASRAKLNAWHASQGEKLGIDVSAYLRKRMGIDAVIHWVPSLINEDYKNRAISEKTAEMISTQSEEKKSHQEDTSDLFQEDVKLIVKDGKLYYLPEKEAEV